MERQRHRLRLLTAEDIEEEEDGEQVQEGEKALVVVQGAEHININTNFFL